MLGEHREDPEERKKQAWFESLERAASRNSPEELLHAFETTRSTGSTAMLVRLAQRERVSVVVANVGQRRSFEELMEGKRYPGTVLATIAQLPTKLLGLHQPLVVDNGAIMQVLADAVLCIRAVPELLSAVKKMRRVLKAHNLWSPDLERR